MARVRIHAHLGADHSIGPGNVRLLEAVETEGSISATARTMGMAYRHAWELIDDLNRCFRQRSSRRRAAGAPVAALDSRRSAARW